MSSALLDQIVTLVRPDLPLIVRQPPLPFDIAMDDEDNTIAIPTPLPGAREPRLTGAQRLVPAPALVHSRNLARLQERATLAPSGHSSATPAPRRVVNPLVPPAGSPPPVASAPPPSPSASSPGPSFAAPPLAPWETDTPAGAPLTRTVSPPPPWETGPANPPTTLALSPPLVDRVIPVSPIPTVLELDDLDDEEELADQLVVHAPVRGFWWRLAKEAGTWGILVGIMLLVVSQVLTYRDQLTQIFHSLLP